MKTQHFLKNLYRVKHFLTEGNLLDTVDELKKNIKIHNAIDVVEVSSTIIFKYKNQTLRDKAVDFMVNKGVPKKIIETPPSGGPLGFYNILISRGALQRAQVQSALAAARQSTKDPSKQIKTQTPFRSDTYN